jgi:hypothetical protein
MKSLSSGVEEADDSEELFDYMAGISDDTIFLCKEELFR